MRYSLGRLDWTLVFLICLALATVAVAGAVPNRIVVDGAVLILAAAKGRRILSDYLELQSVPAPWSGLATAWLLLVLGFALGVSAVSFVLT
jgi:hypothetical protein